MMRGPDFGLVRRAAPASGEDGPEACDELGLDGQFREGWVRGVVRLGRDGDLGVGGDLDLASPLAVVGDGESTNFGVLFGRDHDF